MEDQADVLLNFVLIGGFAILVGIAMNAMLKGETPKPKECKPHKWSHHPETHKLTCTECGYEAGTDKIEPRDY